MSYPRAHPRRTLTRGYGSLNPIGTSHTASATITTPGLHGERPRQVGHHPLDLLRTVGVAARIPIAVSPSPSLASGYSRPHRSITSGSVVAFSCHPRRRGCLPRGPRVVTGEDLVTAGRPLKGAIQRAHERDSRRWIRSTVRAALALRGLGVPHGSTYVGSRGRVIITAVRAFSYCLRRWLTSGSCLHHADAAAAPTSTYSRLLVDRVQGRVVRCSVGGLLDTARVAS